MTYSFSLKAAVGSHIAWATFPLGKCRGAVTPLIVFPSIQDCWGLYLQCQMSCACFSKASFYCARGRWLLSAYLFANQHASSSKCCMWTLRFLLVAVID